MTTSLGQRGQAVIPKAIRTERQLRPGDDFEVLVDEDDADLILLRRIRPAADAGLVEHLACRLHRGPLPASPRRREPMRRVKL